MFRTGEEIESPGCFVLGRLYKVIALTEYDLVQYAYVLSSIFQKKQKNHLKWRLIVRCEKNQRERVGYICFILDVYK